MKTGRLLVLLALVMGLLAGPWQAPAEAEMLGRVGQIKSLDYTGAGNWYQIKPDGATSTFTLRSGAIFCHDRVFVPGFMSSTPLSIPALIAFYFVGPNSSYHVHRQFN